MYCSVAVKSLHVPLNTLWVVPLWVCPRGGRGMLIGQEDWAEDQKNGQHPSVLYLEKVKGLKCFLYSKCDYIQDECPIFLAISDLVVYFSVFLTGLSERSPDLFSAAFCCLFLLLPAFSRLGPVCRCRPCEFPSERACKDQLNLYRVLLEAAANGGLCSVLLKKKKETCYFLTSSRVKMYIIWVRP